MKTILALLLCISITTAQQIPSTITSKAKNKIEFQIAIKKWKEKLKQFNTYKLRKSQKYAELSQEMWKELLGIIHGKTSKAAPIVKMQVGKKDGLTNVLQHSGMQIEHVTQVDTVQQYKPSLAAVSANVVEDTTCYNVPFASKGNTIDLAVANASVLSAEGVKVEVTNTPEWLKFTEKEITFTTLKASEEQTASFNFSVDKSAQVNKEQTLNFSITDKTGQQWTKEITIKIAPPATYELFQNYPNPFNPTTTIEYQLPGTGTRYNVSLKIYDAIGREVTNLVSEQQDPGYYQKTFNANRYASGMYIYRLVATDDQNKQHVFQKKMILVK